MKLTDKIIFYFSSHLKTMILLFVFIFSLGILFFSIDYFSYQSRQELMQNATDIEKAKIVKIIPIKKMSMDFAGNNIYTVGQKITIENQNNSIVYFSFTDEIFYEDLNSVQYKRLINLKVGDSVQYGYTKDSKYIIVLK